MKLWDSFCDAGLRKQYRNLLIAQGLTKEQAETIYEKFSHYIAKIKKAPIIRKGFESCKSKTEFCDHIQNLFQETWCDYIPESYKDIPSHFYHFLDYLDAVQAIKNDFISEEEKLRLIPSEFEFPLSKLTSYEECCLKNGKLVALLNPILLNLIRSSFDKGQLNLANASLDCQVYYGDLLPEMTSSDYTKLINDIWNKSKEMKKGGGHNKFKITLPDGSIQTLTTTEALKLIIGFYGFEEIRSRHLLIRDRYFLVSSPPLDAKKLYECIGDNQYMNIDGATKDRARIARTINLLFGERLVIELA